MPTSIIFPKADNTPVPTSTPIMIQISTDVEPLSRVTITKQVNSTAESTIATGETVVQYTTPDGVLNGGGQEFGLFVGMDDIKIRVKVDGEEQDIRHLSLGYGPCAASPTIPLGPAPVPATDAPPAPAPMAPPAIAQAGGIVTATPAAGGNVIDASQVLSTGPSCGCNDGGCSSGSGATDGAVMGGAQAASAATAAADIVTARNSIISSWPNGLMRLKTECGVFKTRGVPLELCAYFLNLDLGTPTDEWIAGRKILFGWQTRLVEDTVGNLVIYWGDRRIEQWRFDGFFRYAPKGVFGSIEKIPLGGGYTRTLKDGTYYSFDSDGRIQSIQDRSADTNIVYFNYNADSPPKPVSITSPGAAYTVYFTYTDLILGATINSMQLVAANPAYNRTTYYNYDDLGEMSTIIGPEGCITYFHYDADGDITLEKSPDNFLTYFNYVATSKRIKEINLPENSGIYFAYEDSVNYGSDILQRQIKTEANGGPVTYLDYEWSGLPRAFQLSDGAEKSYFEYDSQGKAIMAKATDGVVTYYQWDASGQLSSKLEKAEGYTQYYTYGASGTIASFKDELGRTTSWGYDTRNYQTNWTDGKGNTTYFERDSYGKMVSSKDRRGNTTYFTYDSRGNLTSVKKPDLTVRYFDYNPANELEVVIDELGNVMYYDHDSRGRVTKEKDFLGNVTEFGYDDRNNRTVMIDRRGNAWYWEYDGQSRNIAQKTAMGNTSYFNYSSINLLTNQIDPRGNPAYFYYTSAKRLLCRETALGERTYFVYTAAGQIESVKDPRACAQYFTYDEHRRQTATKDGEGNVTYTNYDKVGNVTNTIDPRANTTTNTYDELNRLTAAVDALSQKNYFYYDAESNTTTTEDALQRRTYYYFDSENRQFCVEDAQKNRTYFTYEQRGLRSSTKDARGNVTYFYQDELSRQFSVRDARNNVSYMEYDAEGNQIATKDPRSNTTYFTFDKDNRQESIKTPLSEFTYFTYDAAANQTNIKDARGNLSYFYFDALNRQFCMEDAKQARTYYTFDSVGNRNSMKDPLARVTYFYFDCDNRNFAVRDAIEGLVYYTFDPASNRDSVKDQRGNITYFDFDAINRMFRTKSPVGGVTTLGFDAVGNRTSVVDPVSRNNYFYYDTLNRLFASEDGLQKRTYFTFDAVGNQISIKNARRATTSPVEMGVQYFTYDSLNRRNSFKNEVSNVWYFDYDAASNLQTQINPLSAKTYWHYDALNRQSLRKDPLNRQWSWSYDPVGNTSLMVDGKTKGTYYFYDSVNLLTRTYYEADIAIHYYEYDNARQQTAMADTTGRSTFSYDNLGRMTIRANPGSESLYYEYDAASNRTMLQDQDGVRRRWNYDASNRMTDAYYGYYGTQAYGTTPYGGFFSYYEYDLADQLVHEKRSNTSITYHGYDAAGRETLIQHRKGDGTLIERFDYTRDEAGNIISQLADRVANSIYTYFNYDRANRVTREAWRVSGGSNVYGFDYVYDAAGNRLSKENTISNKTVTWEYDLADQLTKQKLGNPTKVYFQYDANGNLSVEHDVDGSAGRTYYDYDARNLLTRVDFPGATATNYFYYNALSERIRKDDSTAQKKYTWDGIDVVVEKSVAGARTQGLGKGYTPIAGIGAYSIQDLGSGTVLYSHRNQVGTTMRQTNQSQGVINYYEYDAWGQPLEAHETNAQQYRYTGKELDPDFIAFNSNNRRYHFPVRAYMPFRGSFLQIDPIGFGGALYLYLYAAAQPVKAVDPLGAEWIDKGNNIWEAGANGDTLQALATKISGSPTDWMCIWPVPEWAYPNGYPMATKCDRADVSNLTAKSGPHVYISMEKRGVGRLYLAARGKGNVVLAPTGDEIHSNLQRLAKDGATPIQYLELFGHTWNWAGISSGTRTNLRRELMGLAVQTFQPARYDPYRPAPTYNRAKMKQGPQRCWFTRSAVSYILGCGGFAFAQSFAANFLRTTAFIKSAPTNTSIFVTDNTFHSDDWGFNYYSGPDMGTVVRRQEYSNFQELLEAPDWAVHYGKQ